MKKFLVPSLLLVALVLTAAPALAGLTWCSTDPLVQLPGGGIVRVVVAVPQEFKDAPFTLTITAPAGSHIVGTTPRINVEVVLAEGADGTITAQSDAGFVVRVSARYRNAGLGVLDLVERGDRATWNW